MFSLSLLSLLSQSSEKMPSGADKNKAAAPQVLEQYWHFSYIESTWQLLWKWHFGHWSCCLFLLLNKALLPRTPHVELSAQTHHDHVENEKGRGVGCREDGG